MQTEYDPDVHTDKQTDGISERLEELSIKRLTEIERPELKERENLLEKEKG